MNLVEKYWAKNGKKNRNMILLIDNHDSKCRNAASYLNEYLFGITESFRPKLIRKSKKSKKNKKKKKK